MRVTVDLSLYWQKSLTSSENVEPRKASMRLLYCLFESADIAAQAHGKTKHIRLFLSEQL
jgi:hypothetical protein